MYVEQPILRLIPTAGKGSDCYECYFGQDDSTGLDHPADPCGMCEKGKHFERQVYLIKRSE